VVEYVGPVVALQFVVDDGRCLLCVAVCYVCASCFFLGV
jgi:hypothetical protein